ncbi:MULTISPECIES: hypothetical protein [Halorussus]|uniref:hypothetical protein n=1 Tax=Halorussus TaxID=1070314 RepID=UPI000E2145D8|nr:MULTISPECIES: hypothetical protein [Halorussus]NHN58485.1 hypothetical protein [Halorussus sp. JP-T4]
MTGAELADRLGGRLRGALTYPFGSGRRAVATGVVATATYVLLVLSTFPRMSLQMLGAGLHWFDETLILLTQNTYATNGATGLGLIAVYAGLTGVAVINTAGQVRTAGVSSASDLLGVLPGLVASGCASCGAGLLGFLGFAGAMAALPFHGDLLRVGGIALLLGFLARSGDPRECRV